MYKRHTLENGLRIVTEHIPYVKSISIGVWIEAGSKYENEANNGISHFIEHMLFKGTNTRTAKDIADAIDGVGGQINAFTGKECTSYYIKVLDSHYELAMDILSDMLFHSKFDPIEMDKERSVIMEEISMYEDSPEDLVHDILNQTIFKGNSLGLPILGTRESLREIDEKMVRDYMNHYYIPQRAVISIAGNFNEELLLTTIEKKFSKWQGFKNELIEPAINYNYDNVHRIKDVEQAHLCMAFKGVAMEDKGVYPLLIVNNILGGSMSSRLFQSIREEKGLVYSIYSYPSIYKNGGLLSIYGGMNPQQLEEVIHLIFNELKEMKNKGLSTEELNKAKEQLKGSYILGLESTSSRMTSIGKSELLLNKIYSPKEIIEKIDKINSKDISMIIDDVLNIDDVAISILAKEQYNGTVKKVLK